MSDAIDDAHDAQPRAWSQATLLTADAGAHPSRRCGLDEVGRGALAGPLVAAAVILPEDIRERLGTLAPFLRDSKATPRGKRKAVALALREHAITIALAVAPVSVIDARGIGWANRDVFRRLISQIDADEYVVDGKVKPPAPPDRIARVRCMVKADAHAPAVSAASIIAKVYRDHLMAELAQTHGGYGWERNAGYGSAEHLEALRIHGPTQHHRAVFVATALSGGQRARRDRQRSAGPETDGPHLL
ncbi:MAG TPA: ribonuclease HII [Ktedonobacterales bacterium]|nr:ribonuclease HII [Ktedonobacterales bacterium]